MAVSVQIGLLLALATAFTSILGFLYKQRGAVESPAVEWRRPVRTSLALFRSHWYVLGMAVAMGSWGLHVGALALAPISLVQSVIAGGLAMLTVIADRLFGLEVTRREWLGVCLAALGLAFLAATLSGAAREAHSDYGAVTLIAYIGSAAALATLVALLARGSAYAGVGYGAAAGLLWAASDTSIKALTGRFDDGALAVLVHPLAAVIALASLVGLVVSARSLQVGKAVPVIAVTSVAANTVTIAAGPIVFSEPLPDNAAGMTLRVLAFVLVICAAALTPAPVRAAETQPG